MENQDSQGAHRSEVKPNNVLVDASAIARLADFDLARPIANLGKRTEGACAAADAMDAI